MTVKLEKIAIAIGKKTLELDLDEAKELKKVLEELFGYKEAQRGIGVPYVQPYVAPYVTYPWTDNTKWMEVKYTNTSEDDEWTTYQYQDSSQVSVYATMSEEGVS